jgi:phospholipase/lecithinase/hemolysin
MRFSQRWSWAAGLAALAAFTLAGCGGNDSLPSKANISKVYVMGDSLADVGTFGAKFTVQNSLDPASVQIWPQLIANQFGIDGSAQCNFYTFTGTTFALNPSPGCTNYAIGGGRVRVKDSEGGNANPLTVGTQMAARAAAGNYAEDDLVLIDGGGNDAADLTTAFLEASADPQNTNGKVTAFRNFLLQQLTQTARDQLLTQDPTGMTAAGAYMQTLANTFYDDVTSKVLAKNAKRVGILNIPDITITPKFQGVLATMQSAQATQIQALIRNWITTFNNQLKTRIGTDNRVALVDFYTDFQDEVAHPVNYALSNATDPVCTVTVSALGKFPCLSTVLDASPPTGKTTGWWKSYAFSDDFHPTPYGHQLLAASVSRALARAGWL